MPCGVHPAENSDDSSFFEDGREYWHSFCNRSSSLWDKHYGTNQYTDLLNNATQLIMVVVFTDLVPYGWQRVTSCLRRSKNITATMKY